MAGQCKPVFTYELEIESIEFLLKRIAFNALLNVS